MVYLEILFILALTGINGLLSLSELAIISSRRGRLESMASAGVQGARVALRLNADPGRFLSTVQIGITLVGVLAGAVGGTTVADRLGDWLDTFPGVVGADGDTIAIGVVVVGVTYLSIVVGELVPKRVALSDPERFAVRVAHPMHVLSRMAAPVVWLVRVSSEWLLGCLGMRDSRRAAITEDEIKSLIAEGTRAGIFVPQERRMIEGVLRLADRTVQAIMTPRTDVVWLDVEDDPAATTRKIGVSRFSRLLVCKGSVDHAVGLVRARDLLPLVLAGEPILLDKVMLPPLMVPESTLALKLLDRFRREGIHMAVVVDEFGTTQGLVTPTDILEAIAGILPEKGEGEGAPGLVRRPDGSWLVDGYLPIDEFEDRVGLRGLAGGGDYHTVAGLVLHELGRLPSAGDALDVNGARFEVVDMDGRRIDKLLVHLPEEEEEDG